MLSVITSAYRIAWPSTWRAARPMVWISAPGTQKAFLVRIQNRHQRHLGQVQPFAQQVDADQHIEFAATQIAQYSIRSSVVTSECR